MNQTVLTLQRHQYEAFQAKQPYVLFVTGLGGGKTWLGARWLILRAIEHPKSLHIATGNSYPQCMDVILPELLRACQELDLSFHWQASRKNLLIAGAGEIRIRSTENYQLLRGPEYGSWWADELRECSRDAYLVILGRLRCRRVDRPRYLATTTPNGFDYMHELHAAREDPNYRLVQAPSTANRHLPEDYIENLRRSYDETLVQQEVEGKFVALGHGVVYRAFSRHVNLKETIYSPSRPLYLGMDFGWNPMVVVISQWHEDSFHRGDPNYGEIHVLDEAWVRNASIAETVAVLAEKWKGHGGGWEVVPDPAGCGHNHAGHTDHALLMRALEQHGFHRCELRALGKAPLVRDAVNTVNMLFRNGRGESRLFIEPSCKHLIEDAERCVWDEKGVAVERTNPDRTHAMDALKYALWEYHRPDSFVRQVGFRKPAR